MPADVEVFTGPNCTHCEAAKELLKSNDINFVERSLEDPTALAELQRRAPRSMALPQVFIGDDHVGNDEDLRLRYSRGRPALR